MREAALAFLTGAAVGVVFALARLPIPAPPTIAGVAGVVGITTAFLVVSHFR